MSYQTDRQEFLALMASEGMHPWDAKQLLRNASILHRLAEDECNGAPWCFNEEPRHLFYRGNPKGQVTACGEPLVTPENVTAKIKGSEKFSRVTCPSCKADFIERRVRRRLSGMPFEPVFNGDPRGAVLKIKVPSGRTNDWGQEGICVPVR